jgi:hypothetical protein
MKRENGLEDKILSSHELRKEEKKPKNSHRSTDQICKILRNVYPKGNKKHIG